MRKRFVAIMTVIVATIGGTINPAYAVSKQSSSHHGAKSHESHTTSVTKIDPYTLRYGDAYGSVIKRLIGGFDSAKMQLSTVVAAACSALRNNPAGDHPYQQMLRVVYDDVARQVTVAHPPTFKQAMKECASIFDRTAAR